MTVMLDRFFGVHPAVIRSGLLIELTPSAVNLYLYIMERSEFFCSRELHLTDSDIEAALKVSQRTLTRDRQQLNEHRLIQSNRRGLGYRYTYTICDPMTGQPYDGDPKVRIKHQPMRPASLEPEKPEAAKPQPKEKTVRQAVKESPQETQKQPEPVQNCPTHGWSYPCPQCSKDSKSLRSGSNGSDVHPQRTEHGLPLKF